MYFTISRLFFLFRVAYKKNNKALGLIIFSVMCLAIVDLVGVISVMPVIAIVFDPVSAAEYVRDWTGSSFNLINEHNISAYAITGFIVVNLVTMLIKLAYSYVSTFQAAKLVSSLGSEMFQRILSQPLDSKIFADTSDITNILNRGLHSLNYGVFIPCLNVFQGIFSSLFLLTFLYFVFSWPPFILSTVLVAIYMMLVLLVHKRIERWSVKKIEAEVNLTRLVSESMSGLRDIKLAGREFEHREIFFDHLISSRKLEGKNFFVGGAPKFVLESLGVIILLIIAMYIQRKYGGETTVILLGAMVFSFHKLVPMFHQIYNGVVAVSGHSKYLDSVYGYLNLSIEERQVVAAELEYSRDILLSSVSYTFPGSYTPLLEGINLRIPKGMKLGIVGKSGAGKSTLVDLLAGLRAPSGGKIFIDDAELNAQNHNIWYRNVAMVPQRPFILQTSVRENIKFGACVDNDDARIVECLRLSGFPVGVDSSKDRLFLEQSLEEAGRNLSGGQAQRLVIARALYKECKILILDEYTSSLDSESEELLVKCIAGLPSSLTVVAVSHRYSALKYSDMILSVDAGKIKNIGTYSDLVRSRTQPVS